LRLGLLSGAAAGAVSGLLALLSWGLAVLIPKMMAGEMLGASDPLTPQAALLNTLLNAVLLGIPAGGVVGATVGAVAGFFTRAEHPHTSQPLPTAPVSGASRARVGMWLGAAVVAATGLLFSTSDLVSILVFVVGGGIVGALGGMVGDALFARLYDRNVSG